MRPLVVLFSLMMLLFSSSAQTPGWEFLEWNLPKDSVQVRIEKMGNKLMRAWALDASFEYDGMNTWLDYNKHNELIKVTRKKTFSVIADNEADVFYKECFAKMLASYGKPDSTKKDRKEKIIRHVWLLPKTTIHMEYDYQYKVIDEFGAGSYWIEVVFEAREE